MRLSSSEKQTICIAAPQVYQVFHSENLDERPFGGAEIQLSLLARELIYQNKEVHILSEDYGQPEHKITQSIHFWNALPREKSLPRQIFSFLKNLYKVPSNVCIQRSLTSFSGFIGIYCRITNQKFIYMVAHDKEVDGGHELDKSFFTRFLKHLAFKTSHHVIVQNSYQEKQLAERGIRSMVIPSLIDLNTSQLAANPFSYILWVGRSEEWKRPHLFLDIAEELPEYEFVMICPASKVSPVLAKEVERRASSLANITFHRFISPEKIEEYFRRASIFVNTSKQEGFPNTFIQSFKFGTPVVSLTVNPSDILTSYEVGSVCDDNPQKAKEYIHQLKKNEDQYQIMSRSCFSYVNKFHDLRKNTLEIISLIKSKK